MLFSAPPEDVPEAQPLRGGDHWCRGLGGLLVVLTCPLDVLSFGRGVVAIFGGHSLMNDQCGPQNGVSESCFGQVHSMSHG